MISYGLSFCFIKSYFIVAGIAGAGLAVSLGLK